MTLVQLDDTIRIAIGLVAGRIRRYGEALVQAHSFGIEPGEHRDLASVDYQRDAVPIYTETLPWDYLDNLAAKFNEAAAQMAMVDPTPDLADAWSTIQRYLRSATTALSEASPHAPTAINDPAEIATIAPNTPPVMRFGHLAQIVHPAGAERLIEAASVVELACGDADACPLSEQEKSWMMRIINGDRTIDIAMADGYSERSLYRALSELYERLDVENRLEAIALVTDNGWLDD